MNTKIEPHIKYTKDHILRCSECNEPIHVKLLQRYIGYCPLCGTVFGWVHEWAEDMGEYE